MMANNSTTFELQNISLQDFPRPTALHCEPDSFLPNQHGISDDGEIFQPQLDPADRGLAAWRLLGVAFVFEALLWGTLASAS